MKEKYCSFDVNDPKVCSSTPKDVKEKIKIDHSKEEILKCPKCKKEISMKKHMLTNHEDHQCKECQQKLPTFMKLLKHVVKNHFKDEEGDKDDSKVNNSEEDQTEEKNHSGKEKD